MAAPHSFGPQPTNERRISLDDKMAACSGHRSLSYAQALGPKAAHRFVPEKLADLCSEATWAYLIADEVDALLTGPSDELL